MQRNLILGGLLGGVLFGGACVHCGTTSLVLPPQDASAESGAQDAAGGKDQDAVPLDAKVIDAGPQLDSGIIGACPVEPGWHVIPSQGPACTFLGPDDVHASFADPKWISCTNGRPNCVELERIGTPTLELNPKRVTHIGRALGKNILSLEWLRSKGSKGPCYRTVLLDLGTTNPHVTRAWDATGVDSTGADCQGELIDSKGETGTLFRRVSTTAMSVGSDFNEAKMVAKDHPEDGNYACASPTVLATQNATRGEVYRMPFGSNQAVTIKTPQGASPLILDMVEGNDAFAESAFGTAGWMQWYRADPDGQARLVLSRPAAHVFHLRSDGTHLAWIEGSGDPNNFWPQPKVEVWSAPYSTDLDAVRAGARKLADISGVMQRVQYATAMQGFYAYAGSESKVAVVRESDGSKQIVDIGPNRTSNMVAYVSSTEVWVHYHQMNTTDGGIARIQLAPWP